MVSLVSIKCSVFNWQLSYLYTNYGGDRLPLPLIVDAINQPPPTESGTGSRMTFVSCSEKNLLGYLLSASGPDLCTLSEYRSVFLLLGSFHSWLIISAIGSVHAHHVSSTPVDHMTFAEWSSGHAPLHFESLEAHTLPDQIRDIHHQLVQDTREHAPSLAPPTLMWCW